MSTEIVFFLITRVSIEYREIVVFQPFSPGLIICLWQYYIHIHFTIYAEYMCEKTVHTMFEMKINFTQFAMTFCMHIFTWLIILFYDYVILFSISYHAELITFKSLENNLNQIYQYCKSYFTNELYYIMLGVWRDNHNIK